MAGVYGTDARLLEQLALGGELNISELARTSGLSYPTTFYKVSNFPFVAFEKEGREKKAKINDEDVDAVYPFLVALQTNRTKKAELTFAFLTRKGLSNTLLGGELALEAQLPVKDAEPDPEIEIRTKNPKTFLQLVSRALPSTIGTDFVSNSRIVEDPDTSPSVRIGLLRLSRPEKLLVDGIAEKESRVLIENIVESISNSRRQKIDMNFLKKYAESRGVSSAKVMRQLEDAKRRGFP